MEESPFIPDYSKPDAPGIAMNFDNTVSIYHIVQQDDTFEEAVGTVFHLLKKAQQDYPDWPRVFYVDILGHKGDRSGFDDDFYEFQQEFWFSTIAHFVTAFEVPMLGGLVNPQPQRNDIPDELVLKGP
ncbi:MAG: hypothetical protein COV99_11605 [Bacteroidetes bacterium CG12_big_fil_rev_8_21_14_0_65_60_17]|nr:MAG: hypothetical protein COV99_11605 [Bacteroidetes bacterium CG12_big_fil_rev_8_21_14_0_65_60_17]